MSDAPRSSSSKPADDNGNSQIVSETEIAEAVNKLDRPGERKEGLKILTRIMRRDSEMFSGPLPHPRHLRGYEDIVPGSADRIIRMAESSLEHNQKMDVMSMNRFYESYRRGQWLGLAVLIVLMGLGFVAGAVFQNNVLAALLLGAGVLGAATVYIRSVMGERSAGRRTKEEEKEGA